MRFRERPRLSAVAVAGVAAASLLGAGPGAIGHRAPFGAIASAVSSARGPMVSVIVGYAGAPEAAEVAVTAAGGSIHQRLSALGELAATVPSGALSALATAPGVRELTTDAPLALQGKSWLPDTGETPMSAVNQVIGAPDVWLRTDSAKRTVTGKGIGVALIDSGITPVKGLDTSSHIINGPDLSFESQAPNLRNLDTFGHGTHMAGIILGRDPDVIPGKENDPTKFVGVAPDANLINLKVAAADGAVDVSQVIAAIDWTVTHRNDPGLNIRVLNLSFGTDSLQDARFDPLSHAVEAAWRAGIVVVAAAGNDGPTATRLGMPAMNPYVIAVGAADHHGTADVKDDLVADFSTRGNATRHADLLAPGRSVVSLRDPNSYIDVNYPSGLIASATDPTQRFFRGSGTSQATAVVSGGAALLLQEHPNLSPDQVKKLLTSTATPLKQADSIGQGAGEVNLSKAAGAAIPTASAQLFPPSTGLGSLEQSRGTAHVIDPDNGVELTGERDIMGHAFSSKTWSRLAVNACAWSGGSWNGSTWTGSAWTTTGGWAGRTWSATEWKGTSWSGRTWSGRTWSSATWDGRTWSATTFTSRTWSGRAWSGRYWSDASWK
jgi:serine protease AprX